MLDTLNRLMKFASENGGALVEVSDVTKISPVSRTFSIAPFCLGYAIDWENKTVYFERPHFNINATIHELAHVLAGPRPDTLKTEMVFLWWEIQTAFFLKLYKEWSQDNGDYLVDGSRSWGSLSAAQKANTYRLSVTSYLPLAGEPS